VTGTLYRCVCERAVGSTLCSWNNAASACSVLATTGATAVTSSGRGR
jgi:hypothetical protein